MNKTRLQHRCSECSAAATQWVGRCPTCGAWNSLVEETQHVLPASGRGLGGGGLLGGRGAVSGAVLTTVSLADAAARRGAVRPTGVAELDRVLGGGLAPGSVTLLGGEPGIGKSTLTLQLAGGVASDGGRCLIVTGEESAEQVAQRAQRLGVSSEGVSLVANTAVADILQTCLELRPQLVIVDSIQTMNAGAGAAAGTVTQVREAAQAFMGLAKEHQIAVLLVGHVTKDGALAGPRVLEHLVDTVLEFEGDRHHGLRFLRAVKHRFGATDEVGILEMTEEGLVSVADPSGLFLDDRRPGIAGSIVVPLLQGRRPLLVELQSLVNPTEAIQPRRCTRGLDNGRLAMVLAVLERRARMKVVNCDVYASVVGGVKVDEPGADLGLALAIASARNDVPIAADIVAVGEVGLGGEVRKVSQLTKRLSEVARLGFRRAIVPSGSPPGPAGLELLAVSTLDDALDVAGLRLSRRARESSDQLRARESSDQLRARESSDQARAEKRRMETVA